MSAQQRANHAKSKPKGTKNCPVGGGSDSREQQAGPVALKSSSHLVDGLADAHAVHEHHGDAHERLRCVHDRVRRLEDHGVKELNLNASFQGGLQIHRDRACGCRNRGWQQGRRGGLMLLAQEMPSPCSATRGWRVRRDNHPRVSRHGTPVPLARTYMEPLLDASGLTTDRSGSPLDCARDDHSGSEKVDRRRESPRAVLTPAEGERTHSGWPSGVAHLHDDDLLAVTEDRLHRLAELPSQVVVVYLTPRGGAGKEQERSAGTCLEETTLRRASRPCRSFF